MATTRGCGSGTTVRSTAIDATVVFDLNGVLAIEVSGNRVPSTAVAVGAPTTTALQTLAKRIAVTAPIATLTRARERTIRLMRVAIVTSAARTLLPLTVDRRLRSIAVVTHVAAHFTTHRSTRDKRMCDGIGAVETIGYPCRINDWHRLTEEVESRLLDESPSVAKPSRRS